MPLRLLKSIAQATSSLSSIITAENPIAKAISNATTINSIIASKDLISKAIASTGIINSTVTDPEFFNGVVFNTVDDFMNYADQITAFSIIKRLFEEPVFSDSTSFSIQKPLSDVFSISDIIDRLELLIILAFQDAFLLNDTTSISLTKPLAEDTFETSDSFSRVVQYLPNYLDEYLLEETLQFSVAKPLLDTAIALDQAAIGFDKIASTDTFSSSDSSTNQTIKGLFEEPSFQDIFSRVSQFFRAFPEILETNDFPAITYSKGGVADLVSSSDFLSILSDLGLVDSILTSDRPPVFSVGLSPTPEEILSEELFSFNQSKPLSELYSSDDAGLAIDSIKNVADTFSLSDIIDTTAFTIGVNPSDFFSFRDAPIIFSIGLLGLIETPIIEDPIALAVTLGTFIDSARNEDRTFLSPEKRLTEQVGFVDSLNILFAFGLLISDLNESTDRTTLSFSLASLIDQYELIESVSLSASLNSLTDSFLSNDQSITKDSIKDFTEQVSFNDLISVIITLLQQLFDEYALLDQTSLGIGIGGFTDAFSTQESTILNASASLQQELATINDLLNIQTSKLISDSFDTFTLGSLVSQNYLVDNTYFLEDYVGDARTFT